MDLEERRRRLEAAKEGLERQKEQLKVAQKRLSDREEELSAEHYPHGDDYPDDYYDPSEDDISLEDLVEFAKTARDTAKSSHDDARRRVREENALYQAELSAHTIRAADEERAGAVHWDRRFHTSLAIGHGAAFAAIVAHAFDHDTAPIAIKLAVVPLLLFGVGLLTAGTIPLLLARRGNSHDAKATLEVAETARRDGRAMAIISAGCFALGVVASVYSVWRMAFLS